MNLYHCKLVSFHENPNLRIVQESFFREGNSAQEVKKGLQLFIWPSGYWVITDADELDYEEEDGET